MSRAGRYGPPTGQCRACGRDTWSRVLLCRKCRPRAAPRPPTSWTERKRRAKAVEEHIAAYGQACPGWGRPSHPVDPPNRLTADHVHAVARGGDEAGELQVLCRVCNSSKREGSGAARPLPAPRVAEYRASGSC